MRAQPLESINAIRFSMASHFDIVVRDPVLAIEGEKVSVKIGVVVPRAGCDLLPLGSKINTQWRIDF